MPKEFITVRITTEEYYKLPLKLRRKIWRRLKRDLDKERKLREFQEALDGDL